MHWEKKEGKLETCGLKWVAEYIDRNKNTEESFWKKEGLLQSILQKPYFLDLSRKNQHVIKITGVHWQSYTLD